MGGWGSGRRGWRTSTDDLNKLDVRELCRGGWLLTGAPFVSRWSFRGEVISSIGGKSEWGRVVLNYRHRERGEEWKTLEYSIQLEWTQCHFGGTRPWFICPGRDCGRRVAILYAGKYFLCRQCQQLIYECQKERPEYRILRRTQKLHERLKGFGGVIEGLPPRPKGMHERTYQRLAQRYECAERALNAAEWAMMARLGSG